jgi:hypothetical protein
VLGPEPAVVRGKDGQGVVQLPLRLQAAEHRFHHLVDRHEGAQLALPLLLRACHREAVVPQEGRFVGLLGGGVVVGHPRRHGPVGDGGVGVAGGRGERAVGRLGGQVQEPGPGVVGLEVVEVGQGALGDEVGGVGDVVRPHPEVVAVGVLHVEEGVVVAAVGVGEMVEVGQRPLPVEEELPGQGGVVAGVVEPALHGGVLVEVAGVLVGVDPVVVLVAPGEGGGAGRAAQRGVGEAGGERRPAGAEPGLGGGHHVEGAGRPLVVGEDDQDVGRAGGSGRRRGGGVRFRARRGTDVGGGGASRDQSHDHGHASHRTPCAPGTPRSAHRTLL